METLNFLYVFIVVALIAVIIIQAVERYFFGRQVSEKDKEMVTALLSRNAYEFVTASNVQKEAAKEPQVANPDETDLSEADDESFDKFIKETTK